MNGGANGLFAPRDAQVRLFEQILAPGSERWVMLVQGLPGSGKRSLVDWLQRHRCNDLPTARLELHPTSNNAELIRALVQQLDRRGAGDFMKRLEDLVAEEGRQTLVNYSPTTVMRASWGGSISEGTQTAEATIPLGEVVAIVQSERHARRLDLVEGALAPLREKIWVLFVTGGENLDDGPLRRFVLSELIPRLRRRFPGFRLYITGGLIRQDWFAPAERLFTTVEPLSLAETTDLLVKAGHDRAEGAAAYAKTGGLPLLLALYLEGAAGADRPSDGGARAEWINQSVIATLPNATLRGIAANLALLPWFDLSLLRAMSGDELSVTDFEDLQRRSYIKHLSNGRFGWHDVIRAPLVERAALDPVAARAFQRRAFDAYRARLAAEVDRAGSAWFDDRLDFSRAALASAAGESTATAVDFVLSELRLALPDFDEDYVYAFARALEDRTPPAVAELGRLTRELLSAINIRQWNDLAGELMRRLVAHAVNAGDRDGGRELELLAAKLALAKRPDAAAVFARGALQREESLDARLILIEALGDSGRLDEATRELQEARQRYGDSAPLRVAEGSLALSARRPDEAIRCFSSAIALFPNEAVDARMWLGSLAFHRGDAATALSQAEAVLAAQPGHESAIVLRLDALASLGRFKEVSQDVHQLSGRFAHLLDANDRAAAALASPLARGRLLAALRLDRDAAAPAVVLVLCDQLAGEGNIAVVDELTGMVEERLPESRAVCEAKRAAARLIAGDIAGAAARAAPLVAAGTEIWDAYFLLAWCHVRSGEPERGREVLEQLANRRSGLRDVVDDAIASTFQIENRIPDAIAYLDAQARARPLGPIASLKRAKLLGTVDPAGALEQLREVIHTNNRNSLSGRHAIDAWASYGFLLLAQQQKDEAAKVAATLENGFGGNSLSLRMAAALFNALGDEDSLRRLLRSAGDGDVLLQTSIIGWLAEALLRRKPTAEDLYTVLRLHPDRVEIVVAIVNRLLQLGATGEFVSALRRVEEIAPGMPARWQTITSDAIANAAPQGMRAMAMRMPDPMPARIGFAITLGALGKITLAEAQAELRAVVAERPDLADLCRAREAQMLIKLRLVDEAAQLLAPYAQRDDAPLPIVLAMVQLHDAREEGEAAMRLLRRTAERFPEEARDALEQLADRLINAKRYDEARKLLDRLEQDAPLGYGLMISRAQAFGDDGKFDAGLRVLAALKREGNLTDERRALMCRLRGRYLREAGRIPASIDAFQEAIRLNPRDPFTRTGLAKAYRLAKRFREAYETLLDGVALAPARLGEFESELRELQELAAQPKKPKGTKRRKVRHRTGG